MIAYLQNPTSEVIRVNDPHVTPANKSSSEKEEDAIELDALCEIAKRPGVKAILQAQAVLLRQQGPVIFRQISRLGSALAGDNKKDKPDFLVAVVRGAEGVAFLNFGKTWCGGKFTCFL